MLLAVCCACLHVYSSPANSASSLHTENALRDPTLRVLLVDTEMHVVVGET
jgi:hypothetical protein